MLIQRCATLRHCSRSIYVAIVLAFVACQVQVWSSEKQEKINVIGHWRLTKALDGAEIASLDEHEAQQLVGQLFIIDKSKVQFGSRVCTSPSFAMERVEPRLFLKNHYHASAEKLRLPSPVTIVHVDCTSVFVKSGNSVVIPWKGWFFDAVREQHSM